MSVFLALFGNRGKPAAKCQSFRGLPYRDVFARGFGEAVGLNDDADVRPSSLPFASKTE